jgi:hypothetical protein
MARAVRSPVYIDPGVTLPGQTDTWQVEINVQGYPGAPSIAIEKDPLGDVNKIVRLYTQGEFRRAALTRIMNGDNINVGSEPVLPGLDDSIFEDVVLSFMRISEPRRYFVDINGRRVIEWDSRDRVIPPRPRIPLRRRASRRIEHLRAQMRRGLLDPLAKRCGYVREDETSWG